MNVGINVVDVGNILIISGVILIAIWLLCVYRKSCFEKKEIVLDTEKIKEIAREVYLGTMIGCVTALYYMLR